MSDDSRSPGVCPWDPGEACKVGIGACLPPRKRLLAGLKQSGWLSSSSSYLQGCNGAPCAGLMEELKLEVDLAEANLESDGELCLEDSIAGKQGECNAVESPVFIKSKKTSRRRKSLSVLGDCHGSVNKLQPEALEFGPGGKSEKKLRTNKASVEAVATTNGEKESGPSHKEVVDAARATAARAAKAAAEARAIALDKAAAAAKAAAVATAALEVLALAAYNDEEWGIESSEDAGALRKHKRKGDKLKKEPKHEATLSSLHCTKGANTLQEMRQEEERMHVPFDKSKVDVQMGISYVCSRDKIKEDKKLESHQFLIVDLACAPSDKVKQHEQPHLDLVHTAAGPPPPPLDDEKFARQLHRVMNSSPRISRYHAPTECSKKLEKAPFSTQGCMQNKYSQVGGCNLSRGKKLVHKEKTRISRTSLGKADVKVRSMSAINETLNMLQGGPTSKSHDLGGMVSCCTASHADNIHAKEDLYMPTISTHAFASSTESKEEDDKLTANGDSASSCEFNVEARSRKVPCSTHPHRADTIGPDDDLIGVKLTGMIKKQKSSGKLRTGGSLFAALSGRFQLSSQSRDNNGIGKIPAISARNHPATFCNAISEASGSYLETSKDYGQVARDENKGRVNVPDLGSTLHLAGDGVKEMSTGRNTQENSFCDKMSRATRKSSPLSSHGERHTRHQKVLGVLSNGISKGNQSTGGKLNLPSYVPSPTVS